MQTQPWNLFLDLHIFSSSRLVPLPHCQRYALASSPASLSFAWLHLNPLTHLNGPLWWRARWRRSCLAFAPLETAWKQPSRGRLPADILTSVAHEVHQRVLCSPRLYLFSIHFLSGNWEKTYAHTPSGDFQLTPDQQKKTVTRTYSHTYWYWLVVH